MSTADYLLTRGFQESNRLNLQHFAFREALGYDLHSTIHNSRPGARIADLGTGTGIWLSTLAQQVPEDAHLDGYDVSASQFPAKISLPSNVTMNVLDLRQPLPEDLFGQYDVVHIRLFLAVIENDDPSWLINAAVNMLKPGGHLQWDEYDLHKQEYVGDPDVPHSKLKAICFRPLQVRQMSWVARLPRILETHGMEVVAFEQKREKPWQRQTLMENVCTLSEGVIHERLRSGVGPAEQWKQMLALIEEAYAESRGGASYSQVFQVVVARKKFSIRASGGPSSDADKASSL